MYRVVYVSSATHRFTSSQLQGFAESWKVRNTKAGITGICLYIEGNFMQAFEGEDASARRLYEDIKADGRHQAVITVLEESDASENLFGDWSLDFREASDLPGFQRDSFGSFIDTTLEEGTGDRGPIAIELLSEFVRTMHGRN